VPDREIITGDCVAEMGRMEPGSARLVFADPSYSRTLTGIGLAGL
jgi:hypothetical protein